MNSYIFDNGMLSDIDIKRYIEEGSIKISTYSHDELAFNPDRQIQLGSVDLRFRHACQRIKNLNGQMITFDSLKNQTYTEPFNAENGKLVINPHEVILTTTLETVSLAPEFAGIVTGRSSIARLGIMVHCCQEFINPGHGQPIPLQIINMGPNSVELDLMTPVCQLVIFKLRTPPSGAYSTQLDSKYAKEIEVQSSKIYEELGTNGNADTKKASNHQKQYRLKKIKKFLKDCWNPISASIIAAIIVSIFLKNASQNTTINTFLDHIGNIPVIVVLVIILIVGYIWVSKED